MIETFKDALKAAEPWPVDPHEKLTAMEEVYQRWSAIKRAETRRDIAAGKHFLLVLCRHRISRMTTHAEVITNQLADLIHQIDNGTTTTFTKFE